jgi:hypothetical protein
VTACICHWHWKYSFLKHKRSWQLSLRYVACCYILIIKMIHSNRVTSSFTNFSNVKLLWHVHQTAWLSWKWKKVNQSDYCCIHGAWVSMGCTVWSGQADLSWAITGLVMTTGRVSSKQSGILHTQAYTNKHFQQVLSKAVAVLTLTQHSNVLLSPGLVLLPHSLSSDHQSASKVWHQCNTCMQHYQEWRNKITKALQVSSLAEFTEQYKIN